jgi:cyanophycin synthetase
MNGPRHRPVGDRAEGDDDVPSIPDELSGLEALVAEASQDDVIGVMCHTQREIPDAWIREHGGSVDSPEVLRDKVIATAQPAPIGREVS